MRRNLGQLQFSSNEHALPTDSSGRTLSVAEMTQGMGLRMSNVCQTDIQGGAESTSNLDSILPRAQQGHVRQHEKQQCILDQFDCMDLGSALQQLEQLLVQCPAPVQASAERALSSMKELQDDGTCNCAVLVPKYSPTYGIVGHTSFSHALPNGKLDPAHIDSHVELFAMLHKMRADIFMEGENLDNPNAFTYQLWTHVAIPGTDLPLYSPEGQRYLLEHPEALQALLLELNNSQSPKTKGVSAERCMLRLMRPNVRGIESQAVHAQTEAFMDEHWKSVMDLNQYLPAVADQFQKGHTYGVTRTPHAWIVAKEPKQSIRGNANVHRHDMGETIEAMEKFCAAVEAFSVLDAKRMQEVTNRCIESLRLGRIPEVIMGAGHTFQILEIAALRGWATVVKKASSLENSAVAPLHSTGPDNATYTAIKLTAIDSLNTLRQMAAKYE